MANIPPPSKQFLHAYMLYDYKSNLTAAESCWRINAAFGECTIAERTCQKWFAKFKEGDFDLDDEPRSGRPSEVDDDRLRQLIEADPSQTCVALAQQLGVSHKTFPSATPWGTRRLTIARRLRSTSRLSLPQNLPISTKEGFMLCLTDGDIVSIQTVTISICDRFVILKKFKFMEHSRNRMNFRNDLIHSVVCV